MGAYLKNENNCFSELIEEREKKKKTFMSSLAVQEDTHTHTHTQRPNVDMKVEQFSQTRTDTLKRKLWFT